MVAADLGVAGGGGEGDRLGAGVVAGVQLGRLIWAETLVRSDVRSGELLPVATVTVTLRRSMADALRRLPTSMKSARCGSPLDGETRTGSGLVFRSKCSGGLLFTEPSAVVTAVWYWVFRDTQ
ncbi:hypothetical protein ABIA39_003346 [Nocardia sp. GAS34]|uniref:hypothetical protein n=1 Tax=unclassified Nocardia TaxID=2637762 RepID=UPI003D1B2938